MYASLQVYFTNPNNKVVTTLFWLSSQEEGQAFIIVRPIMLELLRYTFGLKELLIIVFELVE